MRLGLAAKRILLGIVLALTATLPAAATEFHGQVTFGGLPLPGAQAVVTATQGDKTVSAITDDQGLFTFPDLADGAWTLNITMTGFAPIKRSITVAPNAPIPVFELNLETLDQIRAEAKPIKVEPGTAPAVAAATAPEAPSAGSTSSTSTPAAGDKNAKSQPRQAADNSSPQQPTQEAGSAAQAPDGFLVNGSVNNAATSQFSLAQAFGNARNSHSLYNWGLLFKLDSSTLDAKNYSITGFNSPKPSYNNFTFGGTFGGPLKIPHLLPAFRAPTLTIQYSRTQNATITTQQALVPTAAAIGGNLAALANGSTIYAPASGLSSACTSAGVTPGAPFPGNVIPTACISPVATALLKYYPAPNLSGSSVYNYQVPLAQDLHQDSGQIVLQKGFGNKDNVRGTYAMQSARSSSPNIFGFSDPQDNLGQNLNINWYHRFTQRLSGNLTYNPSRQRNDTTIAFENKQNVSLAAGITDNLQDAANWGPPTLAFSQSQIYGLSDPGQSRNNRNQTQAIGVNMQWNRFRHNMQFGGDFRRQQWNYFQQSNPRGTLSFTGAATQASSGSTPGLDFADFLLGLPDTSQIAYGNPDKYLRQSVYDLFFLDDFRVSPELSLNLSIRWDYGAPVTETKNRLVNLDTHGFTTATPVLASSPGNYPNSLIRPDKRGVEPRVSLAWRPISGSSLLVRSSYGIYQDPSVYQQMAYAMANQTPCPNLGGPCTAPWTFTSLNLPASPTCPILLATPFASSSCATTTPDSFAADPNFRVGYVQTWTLSVQRDLPAALQMLITYTGIKGTRGVQEILPNTFNNYAVGAANPCGSCTSGYFYRDSNGNSTREAGTAQLRRRLRAGFQASASYTYSKSLDDDYSYGGGQAVASSGSSQVAQDWLHPSAQRGLSTFDQRHVLALQLQYTTGMGLGGHSLMGGWFGKAYKGWTVLANINAATGTPLTPLYFASVPGSAYTNIVRANYLGGPVHQLGTNASGQRTYLNPAAFGVPANFQWGSAPRDFITGPSQFGLNGSMQRAFRLHDRYNLTAQIDANNVLNHVVFTGWNTTVLSTTSASANSQFGTATSANTMRSVSITLRMRY
jgi:hypothetical protein